ncbi:sigma intracellular receptor 2 [Morus notabilis]|uniref:sigma intracellular receptor 2 n=1 Tax=Morus notabilis TaxID=981085 RepID=UPI000CED6D9D|nr:sigma intracellular receptor 2 [Morus notabilis]
MGALVKLIDVILFVFFVVIVLGAPLLDAQACLPESLFPDFLVELNAWYAHKFGDYLVAEKPHFFVGLVWLELFFQWPLAVLNLYGIWAAKSWLSTTCLIYGASVLTSLVAILSEMIGSGKASDKLLTVYFPFLGLGVLAILRGLLAQSGKTASSSTVAEGSSLGRKKRA